MLSVSGRTAARLLAQRRTFVSPAVLSQPWDTHSVSHLRQEARARGLSSCVHLPSCLALRLNADKEGKQVGTDCTSAGA